MRFKVNYAEVGGTLLDPMPAGYRHLHREAALDAPLARAAEVLMTWELHEACGLRPEPTEPRPAPGVELVMRFAWMRIPCQVIWSEETPERTGFAYGSLDGHPERGEAAFILEPLGPNRTRFTVRSFSKPGNLPARLATPVARRLQTQATNRFLIKMKSTTLPK